MTLLERSDAVLKSGPVRVFARQNGLYVRPIAAYAIDFRLEDMTQAGVPPETMHICATWIAHHPIEDLYIVWYRGNLLNSRATPDQVSKLIRDGKFPPNAYELPNGWWEWIVALDKQYQCIKAAKVPREGELTPDEVDEAHSHNEAMVCNLERLLRLVREPLNGNHSRTG